MLLFRRHGCHRSFWNKQGRLVTLAYGFCLKTDIGRNSLCSNRSIQTRYARTRSYLNIQTRHSVVPCRTVQLTGYASQPCRTQSQINLENLEVHWYERKQLFWAAKGAWTRSVPQLKKLNTKVIWDCGYIMEHGVWVFRAAAGGSILVLVHWEDDMNYVLCV